MNEKSADCLASCLFLVTSYELLRNVDEQTSREKKRENRTAKMLIKSCGLFTPPRHLQQIGILHADEEARIRENSMSSFYIHLTRSPEKKVSETKSAHVSRSLLFIYYQWSLVLRRNLITKNTYSVGTEVLAVQNVKIWLFKDHLIRYRNWKIFHKKANNLINNQHVWRLLGSNAVSDTCCFEICYHLRNSLFLSNLFQ